MFRQKNTKEPQRGSTALEYVLVTSFSLVVTIAAVMWVGKQFKTKMNVMLRDLGMSEDSFDIPGLDDLNQK